MRHRLPLLRGTCRTPARRRTGSRCRRSLLHPLRTARARARHHALEFSLLAGGPFCRACVDGGKCRPAQARSQRAAVRSRAGGIIPARRLHRGLLPISRHREQGRGASDRRPARHGGHADRQRRRGPIGRRCRWQGNQADCPRTRRQRSVRRHAERADRGNGRASREGAGAEQRTIVHCRQAFYRARLHLRRVRETFRRRVPASAHGRSAAGQNRHRAARPETRRR